MTATQSTAHQMRMLGYLTGSPTDPEPYTSALSPAWEHAYQRIHSFVDDVSSDERDKAWRWLGTWKKLALEHHGKALPAPYVFANDFGQIEFEWETAKGELMLRLVPHDLFEYLLTLKAPGGEMQEEDRVGVGEVCDLLVRILG